MKVVILCGGKGTRLREETEFRPKPMVPVGNRPILWHIMKTYAHYGHTEFILCLGYKGDRKSTRLNSSHLVISYAVFCLKKKKAQHDCTKNNKTTTGSAANIRGA